MLGWIKLHRQIIDNELYFSERFTWAQAWIDLLLLASHANRTVFIRGVELRLMPGDLCYSQVSLAVRWRWNFKTVKRFLTRLKAEGMLEVKTDNVTTVITLRNWSRYQSEGEQDGEQRAEEMENRGETNKNGENGKNEKNVFSEVVFHSKYFGKVNSNDLSNLKAAYPNVRDLLPQIIRIDQTIGSKKDRGHTVDNPNAYLRACLQRLNEQAAKRTPRNAPLRDLSEIRYVCADCGGIHRGNQICPKIAV